MAASESAGSVDPRDLRAVREQLGRPVRGVHEVAHRCSCGLPDVIKTRPELPDGTPFPTLYYLTCPRATSAVGTLEAEGLMRRMTEALAQDGDLAASYRAAHEDYLADRQRLAEVARIAGVSAGGMPDRVKCLHVLVAHSLAGGAGVNPLGDWALRDLAQRGIAPTTGWGLPGCCVAAADDGQASHPERSGRARGRVGGPIRVAAVDCGTNSIRLLVADFDPSTGRLREVTRQLRVVRLGEGVDRTGQFAGTALERTFAACRDYAAQLAQLGDPPLRFAATSAARDAGNRAAFETGIQATLGVTPEVISGALEAELSFAGATIDLPAGTAGPVLVVDIGGGSTELVLGHARPTARTSVDIGSVRITERHLRADPPTAAQLQAATGDIDRALAQAFEAVPAGAAATLVGLAGSVTTVAALALELPEYDSARIHHSRITLPAVRRVVAQLAGMRAADRAALKPVHPGRADVIVAGALILARTMELGGFTEALVSEHDILDGLARSVVDRAQSGGGAQGRRSAAEQPEAQNDPPATGDPVAQE